MKRDDDPFAPFLTRRARSVGRRRNPSTAAMTMCAEQRFRLQDLFARYAWAYDCGDVEAYVNLFTPDGHIQAVDGHCHQGHEAIRAFAASYCHKPGFPGTQHHGGALLIDEASPVRCVARNYWASLQWSASEERKYIKNIGYYVSYCTKSAAGWLFEARIMHFWSAASLPWVGMEAELLALIRSTPDTPPF